MPAAVARPRHEVYERAIECPCGDAASVQPDGWGCDRPMGSAQPTRRLPSLDPPLAQSGSRKRRIARRAGSASPGARRCLTALAAQKIGIDRLSRASSLGSHLVVAACAADGPLAFLPCRSWYGIVRAALPNRPVRRRDVTSATMIAS